MRDTFVAVYMPYCLEMQEDGTYAVLNREYKPLGFITREWIRYAMYPVCSKIKGIGSKIAKRLSYKGSPDPKWIHLYNDGCNPCDSEKHMKAYLEKLKLLVRLRIPE